MIVLDASAAVSALLNDGEARRLLSDQTVNVPHLIDVEVVSALRRLVGAGTVAESKALSSLTVWRQLGLLRYAATPLFDRAWELRGAVTAYDATYVALAENLECALVTADARLAAANGPRCAITVVPA